MGKKKVVEYKYNIISKKPKGKKNNVIYTIEYQIDKLPEIHTIKMLNIDFINQSDEWKFAQGWAFLDGRESEIKFKDNDEKKEFLREFLAFQKGGSYRKTHPISRNEKENIKIQIDKLQKRLSDIEKQEHIDLRNNYLDKVDKIEVDKFMKELNKSMLKYGISISEFNGWMVLKDIKSRAVIRRLVPVENCNDDSFFEYKAENLGVWDTDMILAHNKFSRKYAEE